MCRAFKWPCVNPLSCPVQRGTKGKPNPSINYHADVSTCVILFLLKNVILVHISNVRDTTFLIIVDVVNWATWVVPRGGATA